MHNARYKQLSILKYCLCPGCPLSFPDSVLIYSSLEILATPSLYNLTGLPPPPPFFSIQEFHTYIHSHGLLEIRRSSWSVRVQLYMQ